MTLNEATDLIRPAVDPPTGAAGWVDLGAGTGLFTRALAGLLGPACRVVAVDRDAGALAELQRLATGDGGAAIETVQADFTDPAALGRIAPAPLSGVLFANALHYAPDAAGVLARAAGLLGPGGRVVVVEYDRESSNPWVPYPVSLRRLRSLATAGLAPPREVARRPSSYGSTMYCAVLEKAGR